MRKNLSLYVLLHEIRADAVFDCITKQKKKILQLPQCKLYKYSYFNVMHMCYIYSNEYKKLEKKKKYCLKKKNEKLEKLYGDIV